MDENLQVASTISNELTSKVLVLSMSEVANFGQMYKNSVIEYKNKYFRDRTAVNIFFINFDIEYIDFYSIYSFFTMYVFRYFKKVEKMISD
jgi:hypothetical protein